MFVIQDEISRSIVETLRPTLLGQHEGELVVAPTRSLEAYDYYLKGRHYWEGRYEKGIVTALHYFEKAVEVDPDYALPYTGIADTYNILGLYGYMEPDQAREKARSVAERAVELDDGLSEAHASLGLFHLFLDWDWERGEAELKRAIHLKPDNATAHAWLALLYGCQRRSAEAFEEIDIAERIDPLSNYIASYRAVLQIYARDFRAAEESFERILARDPSYLLAVWLAGWLYYLMSRHEDAQRMGERAVSLSNGALFFKSWLAAVCGQAEMHDHAREILDELYACEDSHYVSPLWISWIHRSLGDLDQAFSLLAEAVAVAESTSYLFSIHSDPAYDPLRSDPRFIEIASQVGSGVVDESPGGTEGV